MLKLISFIFVLLFTTSAFAIVNVEAIRTKLDKEREFLGEGEFVLKSQGGNKEKLETEFGLFLGYKYHPHVVFFDSNGEFEKSNHEDKSRNLYGHLRYNYIFEEALAGELFLQAENDRIRALKERYLAGGGFRWKFFEFLYYGNSYLIEYNETDFWQTHWHRLSVYLSFVYNLNDVVTGSLTGYYQPRLDYFEHERLLGHGVLTFKINDVLSSGLSFEIQRDDDVPIGIEKTDWNFSNFLSVGF